jgi:Glu-tRNA(Gln) amidotransferase subunit E-like FAD-binding protein
MKTKFVAVALGAVVLCGAAKVQVTPRLAWAQQTGNPYRAKAKAKFDALAAQLNLSAVQKQSIARILADAFAQGNAISSDEKLSSAQKQAKLSALRAATREKIAALLSPSQRQSAQKLWNERQTRAANAFEEIADELKLSSAQREEVRPIVQNAFAQGRAIFHDASLSFPQKRAKLTQLRQSTREKLASILSAEQLAQLDQMRAVVQAEWMSRIGGLID